MDQFGWSKQDSLFYIGILMVSGAIIACVAFATISRLTRLYVLFFKFLSDPKFLNMVKKLK